MNLKFIFCLLISSCAVAQVSKKEVVMPVTTPSEETAQVARIMIYIPEVALELKNACTDILSEMTRTKVENGVTKFNLVFNPSRRCKYGGKRAYVDVTEDLRPTYYDGVATYKSTVQFK